jgi:hypothetical protein
MAINRRESRYTKISATSRSTIFFRYLSAQPFFCPNRIAITLRLRALRGPAYTGYAFCCFFASDRMAMTPMTTAERRTTMGTCIEYERLRIRPVQSSA